MADASTRARDADRESTVTRLDRALVEGQIDVAEHGRRVEAALAAGTVGDLTALTRDLDGPRTLADRTVHTRPLGLSIALLLVGVVATLWFVTRGEEQPSTEVVPPPMPTATWLTVAPSSPSSPSTSATVEPTFAVALADLRAFRTAFEKKFGMTEVYELVIHTDWIRVEVPLGGTRPRYEGWSYDGGFTRDSEARARGTGEALVDLNDIDFRAMMRTIDEGKRSLGVEKAELTHIIYGFSDQADLKFYFSNQYQESGRINTTPGGRELVRYPYEP